MPVLSCFYLVTRANIGNIDTMKDTKLETKIGYLKLLPSRIHLLCSMLEAYEGLCSVTTIDPGKGLVQLKFAAGCEGDVSAILSAEHELLGIREIKIRSLREENERKKSTPSFG